jgi:hypothetical protein
VSVLALAQPAAGEVVVTKKTIHIPLATDNLRKPVKISMANNGIDDFSFQLYTFSSFRLLIVDGVSTGDDLRIGGGFDAYARALPRGANVGPSNPTSSFIGGALGELSITYTNDRVFRGSWGGNPKNHYLGVRFQLNGQTHYGWIRLTVATNPKAHAALMSATITGYAYETVANKPIKAGTVAIATAEVQIPQKIQRQTGPSLGMLAAGAEGLTVWRREEPSAGQ